MKFLHPDKIDPALQAAMEEYERFILSAWPRARIVVHSDWNEPGGGGHVTKSEHYVGKAVDFHVEGGPSVVEAWLALERFPALMGIGVYPHWNTPGFHADVRTTAYRQRWARGANDQYLAFDASTIEQIRPDQTKEV